MQMLGQFKTGTYTGTAAAVSVTCGFQPIFIAIFNETDGDDNWFYISGLADDKAYQYDNGVPSLLAADGITVSASGFSVGTGLSESAKVFRYIAF